MKWKVAIPGKGSGSPIIWEDKVFVVSAVRSDGKPEPAQRQRPRGGRQGRPTGPIPELQFKIFCFDRNTGDEVWQQTAVTATPHQGTHSTNGFASASPCTDGEHVYAHFGSVGLYCYTMDGKLKWQRDDLGKMDMRGGFGEGSSPTLADDKIIVPWDHQGMSHLYALDKMTGETVWKADRDEPTNWATPLILSLIHI